MAGKAAQQRVFGDEAEIAEGELVWKNVSAQTHTLGPPEFWSEESGTEGEGRGKCVRHRISRLESAFWALVQARCEAPQRSE